MSENRFENLGSELVELLKKKCSEMKDVSSLCDKRFPFTITKDSIKKIMEAKREADVFEIIKNCLPSEKIGDSVRISFFIKKILIIFTTFYKGKL